MNICIVTSSYPANPSDPAAPFFRDLAIQLRKRGHGVTVVSPERSETEKTTDGIDVHWIPWRNTGKALVRTSPTSPTDLWRVLGLLRAFDRELARLAAGKSIDVCLAMWALPAGYLALRARRRFGIPYAVWALGSDINSLARYPVLRSLIRRALRGADWCFADGMELAARASALGGVDCEFLPTARSLPQADSKLQLAGRIRFLYIGRLEPVKGIDVLIAAMSLLPTESGAHLYVRGDGSMQRQVTTEISARGLEDRVTLVPAGPSDVVGAYLAACDCLVIPSRRESIPVVFSEAVNAGTPVIVSDAGDMGRLARTYDLMSPVPAGDAAALARAMQDFVDDPTPHRRRFEVARPKLLQLFDIGSIAARVSAVVTREAGLKPWRGSSPSPVIDVARP